MKKIFLVLLIIVGLNGATIEDIKNSGKIKIGIKYDTKPFGFLDNRRIKGFDIELSKLIIKGLEKRLNTKIKYYYKKVIPANREYKLIDKSIDMVIATYTITDDRKKSISFSKPYFKDHIGILYSKDFDDQKDIVGVLKGSSMINDFVNTKSFNNNDELLNALKNNEVKAIASNVSILSRLKQNNQFKIKTLPQSEEFGIGLRKDDKKFQKILNDILDELYKNGELTKLIKKWIR
jgi:putative glutamine transport system substrate-binding protein